MSGGIRLDPAGIDTSAAAAASRALAIDEVTGAIASVSLGGLEPRTLGRTVGALTRAGTLTRRASGITGSQGPALKKRAALARAADSAGGGGWKMKPFDPYKWTAMVSMGVLDAYAKHHDLVMHRMGKGEGFAKELYERRGPVGARYRKAFKSWGALQNAYYETTKTNLKRFNFSRKIAQVNYKHRIIEAAKAKVFGKPKPPAKGFFGKLKGLGGAVAGKALGPAIALATSIHKKEPWKVVLKRVGAAAAGAAVDALIVAGGGALCAGAVVATAGIGAAACPAIIGGTAAVAGIATAAVINHQIDKSQRPKPNVAPQKPARPPKIVLPSRRWPSGQCVPQHPTARPLGAV